MAAAASATRSRTSISTAGDAITFAAVGRAVQPARPRPRRAAASRKGDRVAMHLPGDAALRWIITYAAIHKAGGRGRARRTPASRRRELHDDPRPRRGRRRSSPATRLLPAAHRRARALPSLASRRDVDGPTDADHRHGRRARRRRLATSRCPSTTTTWPTSCTRRARPGLPKGVAVRHRNVAHDPQQRAAVVRQRLDARRRRCSRSPASRSSTTR